MHSDRFELSKIVLRADSVLHPFKPLKTRKGLQSYIQGLALCHPNGCSELSLCSLGVNFLTLVMEVLILLAGSRKDQRVEL